MSNIRDKIIDAFNQSKYSDHSKISINEDTIDLLIDGVKWNGDYRLLDSDFDNYVNDDTTYITVNIEFDDNAITNISGYTSNNFVEYFGCFDIDEDALNKFNDELCFDHLLDNIVKAENIARDSFIEDTKWIRGDKRYDRHYQLSSVGEGYEAKVTY